jgi:N-acetylglucosamine-6-phosphate deacetylase
MRVELSGFFDLQVNGFGGVDFNDPRTGPDDVAETIALLRATGVTRFLPTLITAPLERFAACARTLADHADPAIPGLHMEGPYIAHEARGVHSPADIVPASFDDFRRRQDAARGRILLVTLAPEVPGALELVERLVADGVRVAIGHTAAPAERIRDAVRAGATLSTHLGNGCPWALPRHPNFIWEQLAHDELSATLITDGHHLPDSVIKVMARAKGKERLVLATDAMAAAGRPPGRYQLGELDVELLSDGRATIVGTDRLAGSALTMDVAIGVMVRASGLSLEDVAPMAAEIPARAVGREPAGRVVAEWDGTRLAIRDVRAA